MCYMLTITDPNTGQIGHRVWEDCGSPDCHTSKHSKYKNTPNGHGKPAKKSSSKSSSNAQSSSSSSNAQSSSSPSNAQTSSNASANSK